MAKYKCISAEYWAYDEGKIYDGSENRGTGNFTVLDMAHMHKDRWEIIKDLDYVQQLESKLKAAIEALEISKTAMLEFMDCADGWEDVYAKICSTLELLKTP